MFVSKSFSYFLLALSIYPISSRSSFLLLGRFSSCLLRSFMVSLSSFFSYMKFFSISDILSFISLYASFDEILFRLSISLFWLSIVDVFSSISSTRFWSFSFSFEFSDSSIWFLFSIAFESSYPIILANMSFKAYVVLSMSFPTDVIRPSMYENTAPLFETSSIDCFTEFI